MQENSPRRRRGWRQGLGERIHGGGGGAAGIGTTPAAYLPDLGGVAVGVPGKPREDELAQVEAGRRVLDVDTHHPAFCIKVDRDAAGDLAGVGAQRVREIIRQGVGVGEVRTCLP
jgi:hypothetical protein